MNKLIFVGWALAVALAITALSALAQQDEGPILRPKSASVKPTGATLTVTCDLACIWKLDGEAKGHIEAGGSAKARVELGPHMVVAVTEDGEDQAQQPEIKVSKQAVVNIELKPARDARLKAEQEATDKARKAAQDSAVQEARDEALRDAQDRAAQQARDEAEREAKDKAALAALVWTDPATGLMWTKKDNGSDLDWRHASDYCRNIQLASHGDWRLPTIDELEGLFDGSAYEAVRGNYDFGQVYHVKGNLQLSGWQWSSTLGKPSSVEAWRFTFSGERHPFRISDGNALRALCVRHSGG